jgi:hypothetical protein
MAEYRALASALTTASHDDPDLLLDHAAEFWLTAGADPTKALRLAKINL